MRAYSFGYGYNALGLTSITYPSGRTVSYPYDAAGRVKEVTGMLGGVPLHYTDAVSTIQYAPHGAVSYMKLGNGVEETARYNSRLQADLLEAALGTSLWKQENFYCGSQGTTCTSNNGNMISQRLTAPKTGGGTLVLTTNYGDYDGVNRITSAAESGEGTGWSQSYGYGNNQFGNLSIAGDGDAPSLRCGSYDAANNRCNASGFVYDNAGNLTTYQGRTLTYDAEGRQTNLSDGGSYEYDGGGRRVKKVADGVTTVYVYDALGRLAAEYASAAPANQPDCTTCYLTVDHLGSTRLVTDAEGAPKRRTDYHPFGGEINPGYGNRNSVDGYATTDEFNLKFTGKERDYESGLHLDYFGARYYAGAQGRFTSPDQPFADQSAPNPQSWNLYGYTRNNPLAFVDYDGRGAVRAAVRTAAEKLLFDLARARGIDRAWALERELLKAGLAGSQVVGTQLWTAAERATILAGKRPEGWIGHHINSVAYNSLEMAEDPRNIEFVRGRAAHLAKHDGSWFNKAEGELIDRLAKLGGPALGVFLAIYDEKVMAYTKDCKVCSDPDSKASWINPANAMIENLALFEAFVAAENFGMIEANQAKTDAARQCALGNRAACGF